MFLRCYNVHNKQSVIKNIAQTNYLDEYWVE